MSLPVGKYWQIHQNIFFGTGVQGIIGSGVTNISAPRWATRTEDTELLSCIQLSSKWTYFVLFIMSSRNHSIMSRSVCVNNIYWAEEFSAHLNNHVKDDKNANPYKNGEHLNGIVTRGESYILHGIISLQPFKWIVSCSFIIILISL